MVIKDNKRFFNGQSFARKNNYGTVSCFRICRSSLQAGTDSYFLHIYQSMHSLLLIVRNHGGARAINSTRVDSNTWKVILEEAFNPNTGPLRECKVWAERGSGTLRKQVQEMCLEYVTMATTKVANGVAENATEALAREFYNDYNDAKSEKEAGKIAKEEMDRSMVSCERTNGLVPAAPVPLAEQVIPPMPSLEGNDAPSQTSQAGVDHSIRPPYLPNCPFRPYEAPAVSSHDRTRGHIRPGSTASLPESSRRRTNTSTSTSSRCSSTARSTSSRLTFDDSSQAHARTQNQTVPQGLARAQNRTQNATVPPGRNDHRPPHRNTVQNRNLDLATQVDNGNTIATSNMDRLQNILDQSQVSAEAVNQSQILSNMGSFFNSISNANFPQSTQLRNSAVPIMENILKSLGNKNDGNETNSTNNGS